MRARWIGVAKGYSDNTFRPDSLITRGHLAILLARAIYYAENPGGTVPDKPDYDALLLRVRERRVGNAVASSESQSSQQMEPATPSSSQSPTEHGMNIAGYCRLIGHDDAALVTSDASGWRCRDGNGGLHGINLDDLCHAQHGPEFEARAGSLDDPNSWQCIAEADSANADQAPEPAPTERPAQQTVTRYRVAPGGVACGGIISLELTPSSTDRSVNYVMRKCDNTPIRKDGQFYIVADGAVSAGPFPYWADDLNASGSFDPIADFDLAGRHNYAVWAYPDDQETPIISGVHQVWAVQE